MCKPGLWRTVPSCDGLEQGDSARASVAAQVAAFATQVPTAWEESDPRYITKSDEVRLRSFTTKIHRVDASVTYKAD